MFFSNNLGSNTYYWDKTYLKKLYSPNNEIHINADLLPLFARNIGASGDPWNSIFASNLTVTGSGTINNLVYNEITDSQFTDKNLYLASSGTNENTNNPVPYLTDEGAMQGDTLAEVDSDWVARTMVNALL